jgi:hypothetical protein
MKTELKEFQIWLPTEFGAGWIMKKATSFTDAYLKLCKRDRMKEGWIYDENDECKTFNEILGIEETI